MLLLQTEKGAWKLSYIYIYISRDSPGPKIYLLYGLGDCCPLAFAFGHG